MTEGINPSKRAAGGSAALAETKEIPLPRLAGTPVVVDGETLVVGKLSINQLATIARQILIAAVGMTPEERKRLVSDTADSNDLAALLLTLDAPTIARLFAIVVDREEEWTGRHLGGIEALKVLDAVLEHNPWDELRAAFLALAKRFQSSQANSA